MPYPYSGLVLDRTDGSVAHRLFATPSTNLNCARAIVYCFVIAIVFQTMKAWKTIFLLWGGAIGMAAMRCVVLSIN